MFARYLNFHAHETEQFIIVLLVQLKHRVVKGKRIIVATMSYFTRRAKCLKPVRLFRGHIPLVDDKKSVKIIIKSILLCVR